MTRVIGLVGWSGSGKTTLITKLIPLLVGNGLRVATVKHTHHAFDIDQPGKDSFEHRRAGASEVIVSSSRRWAHIHENAEGTEPALEELLIRLAPCDLVIVEGFKRDRHPRLEVFRSDLGKPPLHPDDAGIVAIATDDPQLVAAHIPVLDLNDIPAIAACVLRRAVALEQLLHGTLVEGASAQALPSTNRPSYEF